MIRASGSTLGRALWLTTLGLTVATLASAWFVYDGLRLQAQREAEQLLEGLLALRVERLARWRQMYLTQAQTIATDPLLGAVFVAARAGEGLAAQQLLAWLDNQRVTQGYDAILVFDEHVRPIATSPAVISRAYPVAELHAAVAERRPRLVVPEHTAKEPLQIVSIVPLLDSAAPAAAPRGVVLWYQDIQKSIEPCVRAEWLPRIADAVLLVEMGAPAPRLLSALPPLAGTVQLGGRLELEATVFMVRTVDLWGRDAFVVARQVPESSWRLIVTAPAHQLLAPARRAAAAVVGVMLLALVTLAVAGGVYFWWQRGRVYRQRYEHERERRRLLEALSESDQQLRTFFNDSLTGMGIATPQGRWLRVNPALANLLGYTVEELRARDWSGLTSADENQELATQLARLARGEIADDCRVRHLLHRDGSLVPVWLVLHGVRDTAGTVHEILVQAADLSERFEIDRLYETLINTCLDGFWLLDAQGRFLDVNAAYCAMSGYRREELLALRLEALEARESPAEVRQHWHKVLERGVDRFESQHRRKDGTLLEVEISVSYHPGKGGRVYAFVRDISQRKQAERALALERAQLRSLLDGIDAAIYVADPQTYRIIYANDVFRALWDPVPVGKRCYSVVHGRAQPCEPCADPIPLAHGKHRVRETELNGRWYRCAEKAILWSDGRWLRLQVFTDVTERKLHDQQRAQLEKLSSLGQLTAGVAHELLNPLMGIINAVQFCLAMPALDDRCSAVLRDAEHHTRRCIGIVEHLLAFARQGEGVHEAFQRVDPRPLIERVLRLLAPRFTREGVVPCLELAPEIEVLQLQPARFEQVLINLLTNALDAVSTRAVKYIGIALRAQGEHAILAVEDNGSGITPAHQQRVFEPFFTTKPVGKGTGLGLSISWSIVADHGGILECHPRADQGTVFTVTLPRV